MEKVHYVWLGAPPTEPGKAVNTPNQAATKIKKNKVIHFWCQEAYEAAFRGNLDESISVRSIEGLKAERFRMELQLKNRAIRLIDSLLELKAPIMAKDLLNLVLLHTFGGYTFDTTTQLASDMDLTRFSSKAGGSLAKFENAIKKSYSSFVVVRINYDKSHPEIKDPDRRVATSIEGFLQHQPKLVTTRTLDIGYDDYCGVPIINVPSVDIWAMYSPAGYHGVWSAIETYVIRCENLGLDFNRTPSIRSAVKNIRNSQGGFDQKVVDELIDGPSIIKSSRLQAQGDEEVQWRKNNVNRKNSIIGVTAVHSVLDGLVAAYGKKLNDIEKNLWKTVSYETMSSGGSGNRDIVPALGIIKTYNGTWRSN